MKNLGLEVSREDANGFLCAWHYVNHYLGTQQEWLVPKNADEAERLWNHERDREWQKSDDGVFMTHQAIEFYRKFLPPGVHDAFVAMIRTALTDPYADLVGLKRSVLDLAGQPLAAGHGLVSGVGGGLLGGAAKSTVGVNPYKEILGIASKAFNQAERYALTHDQDDQPQMHQELDDNR